MPCTTVFAVTKPLTSACRSKARRTVPVRSSSAMSAALMSQRRSRSRAASSRFAPPWATEGIWLAAELLLRPQRQQVLLLGGDEFGAVDREQRIALLHVLAGEVHVEALDVALELRVHVSEAPLVGRHAADRADGAVDARLAHLLAAHAEQGAALGRQRDHGAARDCRARAGHIRPPACLERRWNRLEVHLADRAGALGVGDHRRVHRAVVLRGTPRRAAVSAAAGGPAALIGTSFMPQMGQSPGLSETTVGCMGQWYFAAAAEPAAP